MDNADSIALQQAINEEMKNLQGTWRQTGYERDGSMEPLDERGWAPAVTFTGNAFAVTLADGTIPIRGTYELDPSREPKTIDWHDATGDDAGKTLLAIYSLEDDQFEFCASYPGMPRPTEFRTQPGQVLRRHERVSA
jgi:uncharacterized protein (TIGR03067 family)